MSIQIRQSFRRMNADGFSVLIDYSLHNDIMKSQSNASLLRSDIDSC